MAAAVGGAAGSRAARRPEDADRGGGLEVSKVPAGLRAPSGCPVATPQGDKAGLGLAVTLFLSSAPWSA